MNNNCPFCKVESEREIIASSLLSVAFYDGFPVSPGHALIIPKRHVSSFFDLSKEERQDLLNLADSVKRILEERYHPDGYNIGINVGEAAGHCMLQVLMHLIPRYQGDVPSQQNY